MHFARSIVLGYHSIPKIRWGSFWGRREEKWGSFRGRFGDHFRVEDHFGVGIISGAVQYSQGFVLGPLLFTDTLCTDDIGSFVSSKSIRSI